MRNFTDVAVDRAVELTKYLMQMYGIDASRVVRHNDISGKHCPGIIGWNADTGDESMWRAFKERIGGSAATVSISTDLLKKGSRGDTVRTMQQMLIACGYGCGATGADGIFGNNTLSALKSFQRDHGLTVDGIYGPKSKAALEATCQSSNTAAGDTAVNLKKGSRGEAVRTMQIMLTACGYDCGGSDGIFGNRTLSALKAFQSDHGLTVDGIYGKNSRSALTAAYQAVH